LRREPSFCPRLQCHHGQTRRGRRLSAVYITGAGVTNALTGFPDIALLTLTEMAQRQVHRDAVRLPCISDADTGYGETLNVARAYGSSKQQGCRHPSGNQVAPKRCGHLDGKQVLSAATWPARLRPPRRRGVTPTSS